MKFVRSLRGAACPIVMACIGLCLAERAEGAAPLGRQAAPTAAPRFLSPGEVRLLNPQPGIPGASGAHVVPSPGQWSWLNPQPEPPRPVLNQDWFLLEGWNWLNPQPEPPLPATVGFARPW
jgi:hypothetical protein